LTEGDIDNSTKTAAAMLCVTSKLCLHSNLQTLHGWHYSYVNALRFNSAARKRRQQNRPYQFWLCRSGVVKNSANSPLLQNTEPVA